MSTVLLSPSINETSVVIEVIIPKSNYVAPSPLDQIETLSLNKIKHDLFSNNADFIAYSIEAMSRLS